MDEPIELVRHEHDAQMHKHNVLMENNDIDLSIQESNLDPGENDDIVAVLEQSVHAVADQIVGGNGDGENQDGKSHSIEPEQCGGDGQAVFCDVVEAVHGLEVGPSDDDGHGEEDNDGRCSESDIVVNENISRCDAAVGESETDSRSNVEDIHVDIVTEANTDQTHLDGAESTSVDVDGDGETGIRTDGVANTGEVEKKQTAAHTVPNLSWVQTCPCLLCDSMRRTRDCESRDFAGKNALYTEVVENIGRRIELENQDGGDQNHVTHSFADHVEAALEFVFEQLQSHRPRTLSMSCVAFRFLLPHIPDHDPEMLPTIVEKALSTLRPLLSISARRVAEQIFDTCSLLAKACIEKTGSSHCVLVPLLDGIMETSPQSRISCVRLLSDLCPGKSITLSDDWELISSSLQLLLADRNPDVRNESRMLLLSWYKTRPDILHRTILGLDRPGKCALLKLLDRSSIIDSNDLSNLLQTSLTITPEPIQATASLAAPNSPPSTSGLVTRPKSKTIRHYPRIDVKDPPKTMDMNSLIDHMLSLKNPLITAPMLSMLHDRNACTALMGFVTRCECPYPDVNDKTSHSAIQKSYRVVKLVSSSQKGTRLLLDIHSYHIVVLLFNEGFERGTANLHHVCAILHMALTNYQDRFCTALLDIGFDIVLGMLLNHLNESPVLGLLVEIISLKPLFKHCKVAGLFSKLLKIATTSECEHEVQQVVMLWDLVLSRLSILEDAYILIDDEVAHTLVEKFRREYAPWRRNALVRILLSFTKLIKFHLKPSESKLCLTITTMGGRTVQTVNGIPTNGLSADAMNCPKGSLRNDVDNDLAPVAEGVGVDAKPPSLDKDESTPEGRECISDSPVGGSHTQSSAFEKWQAVCVELVHVFGNHMEDICRFLMSSIDASNGRGHVGNEHLVILEIIANIVESASFSKIHLTGHLEPMFQRFQEWTLTCSRDSLILLSLRKIFVAIIASYDEESTETFLLADEENGFLERLLKVYFSELRRSTFHSVVLDLFKDLLQLRADGRIGCRLAQFIDSNRSRFQAGYCESPEVGHRHVIVGSEQN